MSPQVTVMVANRNNARYLEQCLSSALGQTFGDFEVLVVDDGSTDNSLEVCRRFARPEGRLRLISLEENRGVSYARQQALLEARGKFVAVLDADDAALPRRLERQVHFFDKHPETVLLGSFCRVIDSEGRPRTKKAAPLHDVEIRWFLTFGNCLFHSTVMYRREAALRCGGYDLGLKCGEDMDVLSKLLAHGRASVLPEVLALWRSHRQSLTQSLGQQELEEDYLRAVQNSMRLHVQQDVDKDVVAAAFFNTKRPARDLGTFRAALGCLEEAFSHYLRRSLQVDDVGRFHRLERTYLERAFVKHLMKIYKRNMRETWWPEGEQDWFAAMRSALPAPALRWQTLSKVLFLKYAHRAGRRGDATGQPGRASRNGRDL